MVFVLRRKTEEGDDDEGEGNVRRRKARGPQHEVVMSFIR